MKGWKKIQQNAESWFKKPKFWSRWFDIEIMQSVTSDKDHFKMSQTKFEMLISTKIKENFHFSASIYLAQDQYKNKENLK